MKFSIEWHEECLKTMKANYARNKAYLVREQERLMRLEAGCLRLEAQIAEAKRRGKDGFDGERFLCRK